MGYLVHKLFHQRWAGFTAKSHLIHHTEKYPPTDLISDKYRAAGKNTTVLLFIPVILAALGFTALLGYLGVLSIFYSVLGVAEILVISVAHNALHDAFHVRESWLHKVPGFKRMQDLHFEHHFNMGSNFGIFDFTWDKVFKTYSDIEPKL